MIEGGAPHDLLFLQEHECIKVVAKGKSITRLEARLTNLVETPLDVVIHPGTYFVADGAHQDMVIIEKVHLRLPPGASYDLTLRVACMRAKRCVPRARDGFQRVAQANDEIRRFLDASDGLSAMAIQAGVWSLSDRYSRADVQTRLTIADLWGRVSSAVTDEDLDQASRVLDGLWIPHGLAGAGRGGPEGASPLIVPPGPESGEETGTAPLPFSGWRRPSTGLGREPGVDP
jgi:hypothetical protein